MKRRRKRKLFGKRNHYRQPVARKLSTGLENLERRALLTGLVGWGEVIDGEPGIDKEEIAFEKMSQKCDQGHFEKQSPVNLKKLKMQKDQQERQATFKQADLDFADFEVPSGRDHQQVPGISGDYYFKPNGSPENGWIFTHQNQPNSHHHQTSNENGRENINTFVYDGYVVIAWENPDNTIGEIMIETDGEAPSNNEENSGDGDTTSGSDGNPGTGSGSPTGGSGTYSGTSGGDDDIVNELETPPEEEDEDLDPGDPPVTEGEGEDGGEDSGETDDDDDDEDDENEEDDEEEEDDGGNSGGGNESNANNDVVLLPTPLDEIIIEDDTGDDDDSGGGGGEDEGDDETIECPDIPPGGSAPTHPDC